MTLVASPAPHSPQKSSPGSFEAPHPGHCRASATPHFAQNLRPSPLSLPHFVQRIVQFPNLWSRALASFPDRVRDADPARFGETLQPRGDVDSIAVDLLAFDHHVAQVHADANSIRRSGATHA